MSIAEVSYVHLKDFSIVEASLQSICRLMGCNNFINMISSYNQSENVFSQTICMGNRFLTFYKYADFT